jgi:hypothetical protein
MPKEKYGVACCIQPCEDRRVDATCVHFEVDAVRPVLDEDRYKALVR